MENFFSCRYVFECLKYFCIFCLVFILPCFFLVLGCTKKQISDYSSIVKHFERVGFKRLPESTDTVIKLELDITNIPTTFSYIAKHDTSSDIIPEDEIIPVAREWPKITKDIEKLSDMAASKRWMKIKPDTFPIPDPKIRPGAIESDIWKLEKDVNINGVLFTVAHTYPYSKNLHEKIKYFNGNPDFAPALISAINSKIILLPQFFSEEKRQNLEKQILDGGDSYIFFIKDSKESKLLSDAKLTRNGFAPNDSQKRNQKENTISIRR